MMGGLSARLRGVIVSVGAVALIACGGGSDSSDSGSSDIAGGSPSAGGQACPATLNVGYQIYALPNGKKAAVWYPTTAAETIHRYAADTATSIALNAEPTTCARFPLVVFSHGLGGCGTQSLFFTETLAREGYVVVAPDHDDAICRVDGTPPSSSTVTEPAVTDPGSWTDSTYVGRRQDVQLALDTMLSTAPWSAQIDAARIGLAGHSLGGYTAVGIAGGWPSWKDLRVKAVLGLSPYLYPFLLKNLLGGVSVPLQYQGAQFDLGITPSLKGPNGAYAVASPPKVLAELFLGSHFEWTNVLCLQTQTIQNCLQTRPNAALINNYAFSFFDRYLKGVDDGLLTGTGAGLRSYEKVLDGGRAGRGASLSPSAEPIARPRHDDLMAAKLVPGGSRKRSGSNPPVTPTRDYRDAGG